MTFVINFNIGGRPLITCRKSMDMVEKSVGRWIMVQREVAYARYDDVWLPVVDGTGKTIRGYC